jgi:hypothetical protein
MIGAHGPGSKPVVHVTLAAAVGAAAGVVVQLLVPPAHPILLALETLLPFGVVYLAVAALLGERLELRRTRTG